MELCKRTLQRLTDPPFLTSSSERINTNAQLVGALDTLDKHVSLHGGHQDRPRRDAGNLTKFSFRVNIECLALGTGHLNAAIYSTHILEYYSYYRNKN
jgi:hypothetical protein